MTREQAERYRDIVKEIAYLEERIENRRNTEADNIAVDVVRGSSPEFPYIEHSIKIGGYTEPQVNAHEKERKRLRDDYIEKGQLDAEFESIEDKSVYRIIKAYFVDGKTQEEIAAKEYVSQRTISNIIARFFGEQETTAG